jgi:hypothetical protein
VSEPVHPALKPFPSSSPLVDWLWAFVVLLLLSLSVLTLYVGQFEETNAYIGIGLMPEVGTFAYWLMLGLWLALLAILYPRWVRSPSDVFLAIYLIGTALWSATYWPATGLLDEAQAAVLGGALLLPALLVKLGGAYVSHVPVNLPGMPLKLPRRLLIPALASLLGMAALLGYQAAGADASFDFVEGYIRRLAGRDNFSGHALAAYLMQMSVNGLGPFLAYLAMQQRVRWAFGIALAFGVFSFWLLALKSPLLNVLVLGGLGYLVRTGKVVHFSRWIALGLLALMLIALLELWVFDLSLLAEYGVRRVVLVSATIQAYFLDALSQQHGLSALFSGIDFGAFDSPEYFIGTKYMGSDVTNANTNAYLHQMAISGVMGYLYISIGTALITMTFDILYIRQHRQEVFALAAMLGALLMEQAFATTLVSSGLLLCLLLVLFFSAEKRVAPAVTAPPTMEYFS